MSPERTCAPEGVVEGIARVVAVQGSLAWLEPDGSAGCRACPAAGRCGDGGVAPAAARRFALDNAAGLRIGESIVVGVAPEVLLKAALTAYFLPLLSGFAAAGIADAAFGGDAPAFAAMLGGLAAGLLAARLAARKLGEQDRLVPRFVRRVAPAAAPDRGERP